MKKWGKGMRRTLTSQLDVSFFFLKFVRWLASWLVFACFFALLFCWQRESLLRWWKLKKTGDQWLFFLPAPILKGFFVHAHEQSFEPKTKRVKALVSTLSRGFSAATRLWLFRARFWRRKGARIAGIGPNPSVEVFSFSKFSCNCKF